MRFKFLNRFFPKLFVGVWLNGEKYYLNVQKVTPSGGWESQSFSYDKTDEQLVFKKLEKFQSEAIFTYIAFLDNSHFQGAIPTGRESEYLNFSEISKYDDFDDILFKKFGKEWSVYTLKSEILIFQNRYKSVGFDYIFSPFFLPISLQKRNQLINKTSLFAVVQDNAIVVSIFNGEKLLYGKYVDEVDFNEIDIEESKSEIEEDVFEISSDSKLERDIETVSLRKNQSSSDFFEEELDLDLFDLELDKEFPELETKDEEHERKTIDQEFASVDVLDNEMFSEKNEEPKIEDVTPIDDGTLDLEKEIEIDLDESIETLEDISDNEEADYNFIYQAIRIGVDEFYNKELYQSDFIENTYIVTNKKVSNIFVQKLEKDYSFDVEKIRVDFSELIVELVKEEVFNEI
ncbi:hypothetical protein ThvES_00002330 [Thiovulum sp. ES]|nr:hypothetical protein ThvES_00002330 [Thiovulum sp. ES]